MAQVWRLRFVLFFLSQVLAKSVAVLHSPHGRRKAHYIINEYTAVCGETTKDHSSKILQQAAAQLAVCLQGGWVCAGTGFFFPVQATVSVITVTSLQPWFLRPEGADWWKRKLGEERQRWVSEVFHPPPYQTEKNYPPACLPTRWFLT